MSPLKSILKKERRKMGDFDKYIESLRKKKYIPRSHQLLSENPRPIEEMEEAVLSEEEELLKQLKDIQEKKKEIQRIKDEREKEELKKKPEVIKFRSFVYGSITFEIEHGNPVAVDIINKHNYVHDKISTVHVDKFDGFVEEINTALPNTKWVNFEPIYQPYWKIARRDKNLILQWNPITNEGGRFKRFQNADNSENVNSIPGILMRTKFYEIPFSEGWRLYLIHPEQSTKLCEWEDGVRAEVEKEFEKRLRVTTIHSAEDSEVDFTFDHSPDFHLRAHQRVALEFSDLVDHRTIVAYGTGTGKTAISIANALRSGAERILFVVPGSVRENWRKHLVNHTGVEPVILAGRTPTEQDLRYLMINHPKFVMINYEILRTKIKVDNTKGDILKSEERYPWVDVINLYRPDYIVVDESHYIRNPTSQQSKALRKLGNKNTKKMAMSGTPIMNRPGELWSVLNWLHPETFPYYETFLNQYGFGRSIGTYEAKKLRSLLETIMIKRTRADISKNLPPVNRIVETFEMSGKARAIYDKILSGIYEEFATYDHMGVGGQIKQYKSILPKINAMIKVCAADKVRHTVTRAIEIADAIEEDKWNGILIFTKFRGTASRIARELGHEALTFVERTNSGFTTMKMEDRMKIVEEFQTNPDKRFLVATEASAREGLDITRAGVVMFNTLFWNPAAHIQCEGRPFYRESDMHGGDSMYLTMEDSIEEWITDLQGIKQNTIDKVVEGKGMETNITNKIIEKLRESFNKSMKER